MAVELRDEAVKQHIRVGLPEWAATHRRWTGEPTAPRVASGEAPAASHRLGPPSAVARKLEVPRSR